MKTILLKFAGPLQAWGTDSHFEKRHTDRYPSKSAVIGMLAACFGYYREEDDKICRLNNLDFAVRIDQPGHILRDYQTVHKYKVNSKYSGTYEEGHHYPVRDKQNNSVYQLDRTYVTERYYLEDAVFVIAIGSADDLWIDDITKALQYPYFQPFLGRRGLPVNPDMILGESDEDVISALIQTPWQASSWYQKQGRTRVEIYADAHLPDTGSILYRKDQVISFSPRNRQHGYRKERRIFVSLNNGSPVQEHDAFGAL